MIGELAALAGAVLWAFASPLLKPISYLNPLTLNSLRCLAPVPFFVALFLATGKVSLLSQFPPAAMVGLIGGTILGLGVADSLYVRSLRHMDLARAYPIYTCGIPLVVILLAALFLGESISWYNLVGSGLVLLGLFLVTIPQGGTKALLAISAQERRGLALVLLSTVAWGVAITILTLALGQRDVITAGVIRFVGAGTLMLLLTWRGWGALSPRRNGIRPLAWGSLNGFLCYGLGGWLFLIGLQLAGAAKTSVLSATSPLFVVPLAALFLKEPVSLRLISGVMLSVAGIGLVVI